MNSLKTESYFISVGKERLHIKRFYTNPVGEPVFMLHGSMSSGRIFYSRSNKGLAPYLANKGYDVYVADLHGRGESTPPISSQSTQSQYDVITQEIPALLAFIKQQRGDVPIRAVAHSWGGILLQAYMARNPQHPIQSLVNFGSKRSIGLKNAKRYFPVDILWTGVGTLISLLVGYLPAKTLKMGSDNETKPTYFQSQKWVYSRKKWHDPQDQFNYTAALANHPKKVPTLHIAGQDDAYLGHPKDVEYYKNEINNPADEFKLLARSEGYSHNYDHVNMLTAQEAEHEVYPYVDQWFNKHAVN